MGDPLACAPSHGVLGRRSDLQLPRSSGSGVDDMYVAKEGLLVFHRCAALLMLLVRAPLAQLAEQLTLNQRVRGSIPSRRT